MTRKAAPCKTKPTVGGAARRRAPVKVRPSSHRASDSYLALARAFPIRPIRSDAVLDKAIAVVDRLLSCGRMLDDQEHDYLESLSHEIERYENEAYPIPDVSGPAMLKHLVEGRGETLSELAAATGIAISTLSVILNGKRKLNVKHVKALAAHFKIEPGVLL
jgi:HTH-type transcriptional regulator / antitoxin HigA